MPPRKRARISEAVSPPAQTKTPEPTGKATDDDILNDPWTDEEEIGLFKGLIKWKPTGIHKHFRMLQLREFLLQNGHIHPNCEHTQFAGIWSKLQSLYDLEALDQREDARQLSDISTDEENDDEEDEDDVYSLAANKIHSQPFRLAEEYEQSMWQKRLADDAQRREESPPKLPELNLAEHMPVKFTPSFDIGVETSITPAARPRGRPPKGAARAKPAAPTTIARRSRRQTGSIATESEEPASDMAASEEEGSAEEDDEQEDDSEEEDEEQEEGEDAQSATGEPRTRGRPRGRPRGSRAGRGRPRGRRR